MKNDFWESPTTVKKAVCAAALLAAFACAAADPAFVKDWERTRRAETLRWFEENQFGRTPVGRLPDQVLGESSVAFTNAGIRIDITAGSSGPMAVCAPR